VLVDLLAERLVGRVGALLDLSIEAGGQCLLELRLHRRRRFGDLRLGRLRGSLLHAGGETLLGRRQFAPRPPTGSA